jgi:hypothetical protein
MLLLHAISFGFALVPGLHRWWSGRRFRNAYEDPALAERWWALRTRSTQVSFLSALVAVSLSPQWVGVLLPVQWLGSAIGGFPARRAVFGESWTLGAYLFWSIRLAAGIWGFWIALAALPLVLPEHVGWAGPLAAVLLLAWQHWYGSLLRWSLGAARLDPGRSHRRSPTASRMCSNDPPRRRPTCGEPDRRSRCWPTPLPCRPSGSRRCCSRTRSSTR